MTLKQILGMSWTLAKTHLKLKSEGSYLGYLWYLLGPLLLFTLLYFIFSKRLGENIPNYALYLLLGIIIWNFFSRATSEAMASTKLPIIKSINFPKEVLVISSVLAIAILHFFELVIFILFMIGFGISPFAIIYYPFIFVLFFAFILGVSFILATINPYLADIENIWGFLIKIGFFATPIFYSLKEHGYITIANLFNPVYYFIEASRKIIIYQQIPELFIILGMIAYAILFLVVGYIIFNKFKHKFAELI